MPYFAIFMGIVAIVSGFLSDEPLECVTMLLIGSLGVGFGLVGLLG